MNGLDLFSGIGGLSMGLRGFVRPLAYCEVDSYCKGVLLSRMRRGEIEPAPIWDDVRHLSRDAFVREQIDIIYGGFPCQDISVAGNGAGLAGERSGLVWHLVRLVEEVTPTFVFLENVPAIRTRGGEAVGKALAGLGFDCRWTVVSAAEVGAPHLRKRWFLLAAHAERLKLRHEQGRSGGTGRDGQAVPTHDGAAQSLADSDRKRFEEHKESDGDLVAVSQTGESGDDSYRLRDLVADTDCTRQQVRLHGQEGAADRSAAPGSGWWATEPDVGRVADGVPKRVDRLRALGNAVVPAQAREAFERLMGLKEAA